MDGALPGIVMWADPEPGVSYYQEYYEDEAEDMGMVVALSVRVLNLKTALPMKTACRSWIGTPWTRPS